MNKRILAIAMAMYIMLPVLAGALGNVKANSPTVLSLQPANVPPGNIGQTFTVKLHVDNITNLWSWKAQVTWDPAYLNMTSDPIEDPFITLENSTLFLWTPYAHTPGVLNEVSDTSLGSLGQTGSGDLATFTFTIIAHGYNTTAINLTGTVMQDFNNPIAFTVVGATVRNTIIGDINGDGKVSLADLVMLAAAYGSTPADPKWNPNADISGNGKVDLADLVLLALHYGQHL
jgi:hypothetical protein